MVEATGLGKEDFCLACYTGQHPIRPPDSMEKLCVEKRRENQSNFFPRTFE